MIDRPALRIEPASPLAAIPKPRPVIDAERLQTIDSDDALAEGVTDPAAEIIGGYRVHDPERLRERYRTLWDSLNAPRGYGWDANPWVWVLSFRRVDGAA